MVIMINMQKALADTAKSARMYCKRLSYVLQKALVCTAKGSHMYCKRLSYVLQKALVCTTKSSRGIAKDSHMYWKRLSYVLQKALAGTVKCSRRNCQILSQVLQKALLLLLILLSLFSCWVNGSFRYLCIIYIYCSLIATAGSLPMFTCFVSAASFS